MGGIFGCLGPVKENECRKMAQRLAHRGKEARFFNYNDLFNVGTIISASGTNTFEHNGFVIVSDSRIYNFPEIEKYFNKNKYGITSGTEAELILKLYCYEGMEGLERINGDFSFALWHEKQNLISLGVDFLGCSPLYYTKLDSGAIAFASEYKALLAINGAVPEADPDMIQHLQFVKKLPVGKTLLKNIFSVPPGSVVRFDLYGKSIDELTMSKLTLHVDHLSEAEAEVFLLENFYTAVRSRIGNWEKPGIALSGGIDSIAVVCGLRKLYPEKTIHTFTAGYGKDDPEMVTAGKVAQRIKTNHHEVVTSPDLLYSRLPELVWHNEDPFARSESLQQLEIGRTAKDYVNVLVAGQGADGLFGGMPKYKLLWYARQYPLMKNAIEDFYNQSQLSLESKCLMGKILNVMYYKGKYKSPPPVVNCDYRPPEYKIPEIGEEFVNKVLVGGFQGGVSQSLHKFERNYAASGLIFTSPFYDKNFIKASFRISDSLKINHNSQKYIFRKALRNCVPEEFLNVPKFPQRMNYDLTFSNVLDEVSARYLSKQQVEERGFFRYSDIERLKLRKPNKPYPAENAMRIWTCLLTEIWAIEFLDKKGEGVFNP